MKKKIYFIISSILQIIVAIFVILNCNEIVQSQLSSASEQYAMFPSDFQERIVNMLENNGSTFLCIMSGIEIILNIIILKIALSRKILKKKGLLIAFSLICFITAEIPITYLLSIINIIVLAFSKRKNPEDFPDPKKEIPNLEYKKSSKKELILSIMLLIIYVSQFFLDFFFSGNESIFLMFGAIIIFYIIALITAILVFKDKLKHDIKIFYENSKAYIQYVLPKIGIMYLIYIICNIICTFISKQAVSVNQSTLESLPKWFVIPAAIIWAPIVEELVFRGVLRRFIKKDALFIIISALLFGLIHTISEQTLLNTFVLAIPYCVLGGFLAYIYDKTNNICTNILSHSFINIIALSMSYLMTGFILF